MDLNHAFKLNLLIFRILNRVDLGIQSVFSSRSDDKYHENQSSSQEFMYLINLYVYFHKAFV